MEIRPTYARIAARCGVNSSTVSRALNNHRSIPEATRKRIIGIAESMGWRPNPLASAYMAHLRATHPPSFKASLGIVVDYPMPRGIEDLPGHVRRIFAGAEARAAEYGYRVHAFSLEQEEMTPAKLDRTLFNRNIPGFIVTGLRQPGRMLKGLNWNRYATVATGFSMTKPQVHRVVTDVMHGFSLVIEQAFAMGYRRIGVAVSEEYDRRTNHGVMFPVSYMREHLARGQSLESIVFRQSDERAIPLVARWLEEHKPELVIGNFVWEAIESLGWRVPQDIAFATFDRSTEYANHAGLDQRHEVIGRVAADVLITEITHNRRGVPVDPVQHAIKGQWVDGPSAPKRSMR